VNEEIWVDLYAPDGSYVASGGFIVKPAGNEFEIVALSPEMGLRGAAVREIRNGTSLEFVIPLWWPTALPTGEWYVIAKSSSAYFEGPLEVEPYEGPAISILLNTRINPFERQSVDACSAGQEVIVMGTNFVANSEVPLAVYRLTEEWDDLHREIALLVRSKMATTDGQGNLSTSFRVEPTDPAGTYSVIA
jgi:hypothetical protein